MGEMFSSLVALGTLQAWLYRIDSKTALRATGFHALLYFSLLMFVQGLKIFCALFEIQFYEIPLLALILFLVFAPRPLDNFLVFGPTSGWTPNFYLLTGFAIGFLWQTREVGGDPLRFAEGYGWSFFAAALLPIFSAIKERLALLDTPAPFRGLPVFVTATGIFLLGLLSFIH